MKNYRVPIHIFFAILFFGSILIGVQTTNGPVLLAQSVDVSPTATSTPAPTPSPTPMPLPTRLQIPDLGVDTNIQAVGQITEGQMGVPNNFTDVAWYNLGPRPGETGNALIDGHFDTETGAPAVFYYLRSLHQGSQINVTTVDGTVLHYVVTQVTSYPSDNFPFDIVAGETDKKHLNLITCGGQWDHINHNYSQRAVVFSELQEN